LKDTIIASFVFDWTIQVAHGRSKLTNKDES